MKKNKDKTIRAGLVAAVVTYMLDSDCRKVSGREHRLGFLGGDNGFLSRLDLGACILEQLWASAQT